MDPQERAWYDAHRDQILRGKDVGEEMDESDVSYLTKRNLQEYMEKGAFKGYAKTKNGDDFFSVFSGLFQRLDKEEEMEEGAG
jgi:DnaJ family protein A protein 5